MKRTYTVDMIHGPILPRMISYGLPLLLTGVLQLLFHAADIVVVGQYSGSTALAAVGSTNALTNLLINLFMGLSIGTSVLVARYIGSRSYEDIEQTVHTAIKMALYGGVIMIFVGLAFAEPLLVMMGIPLDVLSQSVLYMRIYFLCMPAFMVYSFGAAVLRAVGDTRRPLYYLTIAGVANVCLNLIFVIVFNMGVAGVASATAISQVISAVFVTNALIKSDGAIRLQKDKFKIHKEKLIMMLKIGLPAGLQGTLFSFSNVLIQSSINTFGSVAMAANTAAGNIEGFIYIGMNSVYQTALSFTSQNVGAKKPERIISVFKYSTILVVIIGLVLGIGAYVLGEPLLRIYTQDPAVIEVGLIKMGYICTFYVFCGFMEVICGLIRGLGNSLAPMLIVLIVVCGFRIVWVLFVFPLNPTLGTLFVSYPISWTMATICEFICFAIVYKKFCRSLQNVK